MDNLGQWNGILCVFPTVAGRTYTVHYTLGLNGGPKLTPFVRNNVTSANIQVQHITSDGRYTLTFVAPSSETMFAVENPNTGTRSMYLSYLFVQDVNAAAVVEDFYYVADVKSYSDYMPFGMQMPNRNGSDNADSYRYGFQGQEKDDEVKGEGNSVNYKYRMHDPRIGRFFAVDPLAPKYPHYSPYSFSGNKVIHAIELEGLEEKIVILSKTYEGGKRVIELSNSESISDFIAERNSWSNAFIDFNEAWNKNSNHNAFKRIKLDESYLFKGTLTIDLRGGKAKASFTLTDNSFRSVYIGKNNPKTPLGEDLYDIYPQDAADAAARVHDLEYDKVRAAGISGVLSRTTLFADINLVRTTGKIMEMYKNKEIDPFTKKPVSKETYNRAKSMNTFFTAIVYNKMTDKTNIDVEMVQRTIDYMQAVESVDINEATGINDFED